jgi:hypothetical protein
LSEDWSPASALAPGHDRKAVEDSYADNVLKLTLARSYIRRLLEHTRVVKFLKANHAEIHAGFESIAAAEAL